MTESGALSAEVVIALRGLVVGFGQQLVLKGVDLDVRRGEVLGLVGPSGGGKSVLTRTILGLTPKRAGTIQIFGQDVDALTRTERNRQERRWGVLFQQGALFSGLNVLQNVEAPMREHLPLDPATRTEIALMKLDLVGLARSAASKLPSELSGGMVKRAALARALALDPEIVFLDEPTAGMDAFGRRVLWDEVERLKAEGKTLVLTTHYIEEAERLCDEICIVQAGKVVARDTPAALIERYGGDARIDFVARGFSLTPELDRLGTWTRTDERYALCAQGAPGLALGTIVARANALGVTIDELDLHRPGLEDAFIAITGETLDDEGARGVAA